ncbi:hypothetical protein B0O80DRAFT_438458 [Mortierella sp. GBAus27b]|nr:hypothetical protein B0O80DRAFT_438458 [Mortierella sp. GBAus27b]
MQASTHRVSCGSCSIVLHSCPERIRRARLVVVTSLVPCMEGLFGIMFLWRHGT